MPKHGYLYFFEHLQPFARIEQGDVLGRGDDDRTADRDLSAPS